MTSKKDHIAIVGAGFSGLACAYYLSKAGRPVTIYDPEPLGKNASGISAGLLHFYTGARAKPPFDAERKLTATLDLLNISSDALGTSVFKKTGLFRPALTPDQEKNYLQRAENYDDISWLTPEQIEKLCPQLHPFPGIWIDNGYFIETGRYLEGLWSACEKLGAQWKKREIADLEDLSEPSVIAATGAAPLLRTLEKPIHPIKGQILEIEWDIQLPFPISANIYLVPGSTSNRCIVGGTFEHHFQDSKPDISTAKQYLFPKIKHLFPDFTDCSIVNCLAALRGSTPDRLPHCQRISEKLWVLAGMGSKGLLHHAYFAKKLTDQFLAQHP